MLWAIDHQEPIAVYGDYDVDGVSATALLTEVLRCLGAQVAPYIPNRFDEGYGLNNEALDHPDRGRVSSWWSPSTAASARLARPNTPATWDWT